MRSFWRRLADFLIVAAVIAGGYAAYLHRWEISDWFALRNYTPPPQVSTLAASATMTDYGKRLFYRAKPQIDADRAALVRDCDIQGDKTIELGCYLSNDQIYLLGITDTALQDEVVVTAAHETLHAAYARMSQKEKRHMDALVEQAAGTITDPELKQRLADYDKTEPGQRDNELHSILGTEYAQLPPELERYYAQYFNNRHQIVTYNTEFNAVFNGLRAQITQLDAKIQTTKSIMNRYLASGQIPAYNALVPTINTDITTYNAKVEQYNKYANTLLGTEAAPAAK